MPELPEVETIRRSLERRVLLRTIQRVDVRETRFRVPIDAPGLARKLLRRRITAAARRSKYLLLHLDDEQVMVVHLGMSGSLVLSPESAPLPRHAHVVLRLDGGEELRFIDPRRFGMLFVVPDRDALSRDPRLVAIGPEPLSADFDLAYLRRRACRVRKPVKNFLLDSTVVAGIGNIYACESLFAAGIHPRTPAGRLSGERLRRLHGAVLTVLRGALRSRGTTLQDYRDSDGRPGANQRRLRVYGREGEPCLACRHPVRRVVQAGRSTFYCPRCQQ